jgi:ABC-2 type transport system permease protein
MVSAYAAAAASIVRRDYAIFASYRLRFLAEIASAVLGVTLFYYISRLVTGGGFASADAYFSFAVVGLAVLQVLTATLVLVPQALRLELVAGTFERVMVSPFGPVKTLLAMAVFPFVSALVNATITIVFAALVFGMPMRWSTAPLALPVAVLGGLAFLPLAVVITGAVLVVKKAGTGGGMLVTLLMLVGGVLFPIALLPDWIEWASNVQPLTPAAGLLRHLISGSPIDSTSNALVRLVVFAAVLLPVSVLLLRMSIRYGQRRGTVLEY